MGYECISGRSAIYMHAHISSEEICSYYTWVMHTFIDQGLVFQQSWTGVDWGWVTIVLKDWSSVRNSKQAQEVD